VDLHKAHLKLFQNQLPDGQRARGQNMSDTDLRTAVEFVNMMRVCGIPLKKFDKMKPWLHRVGCGIQCGKDQLGELISAVHQGEIQTIIDELSKTQLGTLYSVATDGTTDDGAEVCAVVLRWINKFSFQPEQRLILLDMLAHSMTADDIVHEVKSASRRVGLTLSGLLCIMHDRVAANYKAVRVLRQIQFHWDVFLTPAIMWATNSKRMCCPSS
jgi:hypothetical protein